MADTISIELQKDDVVRMVCGSVIPFGGIPGATRWNGNQHNESWAWDRDALGKLSIEELMHLYATLNWNKPEADDAPRILLPAGFQAP